MKSLDSGLFKKKKKQRKPKQKPKKPPNARFYYFQTHLKLKPRLKKKISQEGPSLRNTFLEIIRRNT